MNQEQNTNQHNQFPIHLLSNFQQNESLQNLQYKHTDDIILNKWFSSLKNISHESEQETGQKDMNAILENTQICNQEQQELKGDQNLNKDETNLPNIQRLSQQIKYQLPEILNLSKQKSLNYVPINNSDGEFPRFLEKFEQTFQQKVNVFENFVKQPITFTETHSVNSNQKNNPYDNNKILQKDNPISSQKTNVLKPSNLKSKNQLHKKIDIFHCQNPVPIIICPKSHSQNQQNFQKQTQQTDKITNKTILFFDNFQLQKNNQNTITQFTISQNHQNTVFIGQIDITYTMKIIKKIQLQSKLTSCHYINAQKGKLFLGCSNGYIYIIQQSQLLDIPISQQIIIKQKNIINTNLNKQITHIIPHLQKHNIIYFIIAYTEIKTYIIHQNSSSHQIITNQSENYIEDPQKQPEISSNQTLIQQSHNPIKNTINFLKIITLPNSLTNLKQTQTNQKAMIIHTNNMLAPCILNTSEVQFWFPQKINQLVIAFNSSWRHFNFLETSSQSQTNQQHSFSLSSEEEIKDQDIAISNIKIIDYGTKFNKIVVGTHTGTVIFGQIVRAQSCWPNEPQANIQTSQAELNLFEKSHSLQSSEQQCQQKQQKNNKIQNSPTQTNPKFKYFFQQQFAFQQGTKINSLQILNYQTYTCIATNTKIIFYDILQRKKYSQGLKQKSTNQINLVKWTKNQSLLLCSIYGPQGKVYAYTKPLPIRKEITDQL